MLPNIRAHSIMVARVAGFLGARLSGAGQEISLPLIVSGALLHDIAKTQTLNNDGRHDELGGEICRTHGFDELADIVAEHVILKNGVPFDCCAEKEIVYYADKRVRHEEIVSLVDRLDYIIERYGNGDEWIHERIRENFANAHAIEDKIFSRLDVTPSEVAEYVNGHVFELDGLKV